MANDAVETLDYKGYKIEIFPDQDARSPDEDGDDSLFLVHYHRQFQIEHKSVISEEDTREIYQGTDSVGRVAALGKKYHIFDVKALIHGGGHLSLGTGGFMEDPGGWDTSHVGLVLASKEEFPTWEQATKAAESLISTWNQYLSGDIYGYTVTGGDGRFEREPGSSVWGFYGTSAAIEAAKEEINGHIVYHDKQHAKMVHDVTRGAKQLAKPIAVRSHLRDGRPVRRHRRRRS